MNFVEVSRRAGDLRGHLNRDAMNRLIQAIDAADSFEAISEPYKTWLTDKASIVPKDLSDSARRVLGV